ncbi:MAG: hypothetical protein HQL93_05945 [Magnetococcales bacterium]|nr:hypothetical protein [Magnetococcales bacterium]
MKKMVCTVALTLGMSLAASALFAGPIADSAKAGMSEARENLLALLDSTDKNDQAKRIEAIKAATAKVDGLVMANAEAFKSFNEVYSAFKATRDGELVPMVLAGKKDEAKAIGKGIQAERFKKMMEILGTIAQ